MDSNFGKEKHDREGRGRKPPAESVTFRLLWIIFHDKSHVMKFLGKNSGIFDQSWRQVEKSVSISTFGFSEWFFLSGLLQQWRKLIFLKRHDASILRDWIRLDNKFILVLVLNDLELICAVHIRLLWTGLIYDMSHIIWQ